MANAVQRYAVLLRMALPFEVVDTRVRRGLEAMER